MLKLVFGEGLLPSHARATRIRQITILLTTEVKAADVNSGHLPLLRRIQEASIPERDGRVVDNCGDD